MSKDHQAALNRWAEVASEYAAIEEFIAWAGSEHRAEFRALEPYNKLTDLLDECYDINRQDLEAARRSLLEEARVKTKRIRVVKPREEWWHADVRHLGRPFDVRGEYIHCGLPCYIIPCPEAFGPEAYVPVEDCVEIDREES